MKLKIKKGGSKIGLFLILPSHMLFSRAAESLAVRVMKKHGFISDRDRITSLRTGLSEETMKAVFKEARRFHHKHKRFVLVEINSSEGYNIKITL